MPSGLRKTSGNHFEIYYEQPWGGIASNAHPVDIQPNQFVTCQGAISNNGELGLVSLTAVAGALSLVPHVTDAVALVIFTQLGNFYAVDQFGNMYESASIIMPLVYKCSASDGPWVGLTTTSSIAVKVINGVAYLSVFNRNSIYSYDGAVAFTLGSNYVGGLVLGVLDDYLLMLNCNQATGGVSSSMVSWSGPGEFTTWNPGTNQLAGYNELATIDDQLTGFLSFASVGVAISAKSLVELSPTGVGIGPFNFTALWTSVIGQGSIYPLTITQYGQNGYLMTDSGVYAVSASAGFSDISGVAKEAILGSFQIPSFFGAPNSVAVAGDVLLQFSNSQYPTPFYVVAAPATQAGVEGQNYILWLYDLAAGTWYSTAFNTAALCNQQNGTNIPTTGTPGGLVVNMNVVTLQSLSTSMYTFGNSSSPITLIYFNVFYNSAFYQVVAQVASFNSKNLENAPIPGPLNLVFRQEEVKLGRKPTIRRAIVKAYGSGLLTLSVSGKPFGTISVNSVTPVSYETTMGIYTGEDPQLTITCPAWQGSIVKVMLAGTYADGDID